MNPGRSAFVAQIHHPRGRPFERHHLVHRSGGHDGFATNRDRFHGGLLRIHGDDIVAEEDGVRGRACILAAGGHADCKSDCKDDEGLLRPAHGSLHT